MKANYDLFRGELVDSNGSITGSVLKVLEETRVLRVNLSEDEKELGFTEMCDGYFGIELTKAEAIKLVKELQTLIDLMKE